MAYTQRAMSEGLMFLPHFQSLMIMVALSVLFLRAVSVLIMTGFCHCSWVRNELRCGKWDTLEPRGFHHLHDKLFGGKLIGHRNDRADGQGE